MPRPKEFTFTVRFSALRAIAFFAVWLAFVILYHQAKNYREAIFFGGTLLGAIVALYGVFRASDNLQHNIEVTQQGIG